MFDGLSEVGKTGRRFAIVLLGIATFTCGATFLGTLVLLVLQPPKAGGARPHLGGLAVAAILTAAPGAMLVRLLRGDRARNGLTVMPLWFIEVCGVVLLVGTVASMFLLETPWLICESFVVVGGMLFVRSRVRRRLREMDEQVAVEHGTRIDEEWSGQETILIGDVPPSVPTPDLFVTVRKGGTPYLRIEVFRARGDEARARTEAIAWGQTVAIGFGHQAFTVQLDPDVGTGGRETSAVELGSYFGKFYPLDSCLLVASADRLFRIDPDSRLCWVSAEVGIDGVVVSRVAKGVIEGEGEFDPPGGWHPFRIALETGQPA